MCTVFCPVNCIVRCFLYLLVLDKGWNLAIVQIPAYLRCCELLYTVHIKYIYLIELIICSTHGTLEISVVTHTCFVSGAEDCSAPQHNQIQPLPGHQPDAHLFLQQVSLPDTSRALMAHCSLQTPRGANQSVVYHTEAEAGHQLVTWRGIQMIYYV